MLTPKPGDMLSRYLTRFAVSDAKLTIFDEETRSYWNAEKAALTFDRKTDGVVVSVAAPLRLADKSSWLFTASANYTNGSDNVALQAAFKPVRLSVLAASGAGLKALKGHRRAGPRQRDVQSVDGGPAWAPASWCSSAGDGHLQLPALKKDPIHVEERGADGRPRRTRQALHDPGAELEGRHAPRQHHGRRRTLRSRPTARSPI